MLIDLHAAHSPEAIREILSRLKHPERLEVVVIDMCAKLRQAVETVWPWAEIRIDLPHVGRHVDNGMRWARKHLADREAVRLVSPRPGARRRENLTRLLLKRDLTVAQAANLNAVLRRCPRLAEAHALHNQLWRIVAAPSRHTAEMRAAALPAHLPPHLVPGFGPVVNLFRGVWAAYIFNSFHLPRLTNARTEALNRRIKELFADGRGNLGFDGLRLRALHHLGRFDDENIRAAALAIAGEPAAGRDD